MRKSVFLLFLCFCVFVSAQKDSTKVSLNGQFATWGIVQLNSEYPVQLGARLVPALSGKFLFSTNSKIDFEVSVNSNVAASFTGLHYDSTMTQLKLYRAWASYSGANWEVRAGLQKISFGSSALFRPLMWFDGVDVRDPLQLTDGVYGLLGKYYFENNANLWIWGLLGNDLIKGYENVGTSKWKPEIGARIQLPVGSGKIALTSNNRHVVIPAGLGVGTLNEIRVGLDGRWDFAVGLWFEASATSLEVKNINSPDLLQNQDIWNVGVDYNIPIGSGIKLDVEFFRYHSANKLFVGGLALNVLGTMVTFPMAKLDNLSAMAYYLPDQGKWMNYLSWNRITSNDFSFHAIGYWNPSDVELILAQLYNPKLFVGRGLQIMLSYKF